uniref:ornithine decarboxylase n=1 Tax=Anopheles minimus TaxID=112268 RepID=A0A182W1U6_9DIPT
MSVLECPSDLTLISDAMSIGDVIQDIIRMGPHEDPLHVLDLDDVVRKHYSWCAKMPRVKPYYAVKCNDDPRILQTLMTLGTGFDCASKGEMERMLGYGVKPENIIFAQPAKSIPSLLYARSKQVSVMTFDGAVELEKIHQYYPEARLVLRMRHDSLQVRCSLGKKFGCDPVLEAPELLRYAATLRMNVIGISFHVGSDCDEHQVYYEAVKIAKNLFDYAKTIGYEFSLLDIGGGFPGDNNKPIDRYAKAVNVAIDHYFPAELDIRIIAEPGRYYVASAVTLVSFVDSKRVLKEQKQDGTKQTRVHYYLNDGIFGTFYCTAHEAQPAIPIVERKAGAKEYNSTVWGPTCDVMDLILPDVLLPELDIGDSVVFENVGAYGQVLSCRFNGFALPKVVAYLREGTWKIMQEMNAASTALAARSIDSSDGKLLVTHESYSPIAEATYSHSSVEELIRIISKRTTTSEPSNVLNLDDIVSKHRTWQQQLPTVAPFYAVKCNSHPAILRLLVALGCGFDCASKVELETVLGLGVTPDRIVYANPNKSVESILYAKQTSVKRMTFDGSSELDKISSHFPEAELILRIRYDARVAQLSLGRKFGCHPDRDATALLQHAKALGLCVIGVSFHVGSGSMDAECFYGGIQKAMEIFDLGRLIGIEMQLLDIGGGYPGADRDHFLQCTSHINKALEEFVGSRHGTISVIAEPGRYYVESAVTALVNVVAKSYEKDTAGALLRVRYYVDDGLYDSFDWCDAHTNTPVVHEDKRELMCVRSVIYGRTMCEHDVIREEIFLPEHEIGDCFIFPNKGAYGKLLGRGHNGFPPTSVKVCLTRATLNYMCAAAVKAARG